MEPAVAQETLPQEGAELPQSRLRRASSLREGAELPQSRLRRASSLREGAMSYSPPGGGTGRSAKEEKFPPSVREVAKPQVLTEGESKIG